MTGKGFRCSSCVLPCDDLRLLCCNLLYLHDSGVPDQPIGRLHYVHAQRPAALSGPVLQPQRNEDAQPRLESCRRPREVRITVLIVS